MRLTSKNVEKFQHDGLVVDTGWSEFNYAKADAKAQESFRDHVGRLVQIHPDDVAQLAELGLALGEGGRIVKAKLESPGAPESNGKAGEPKGKTAK